MGYILCTATCFGCKQVFSFNPAKVPSIRIDGNREPICLDCVGRVNPKRIANGLEPIVPAPDAYSAADENEVDFG